MSSSTHDTNKNANPSLPSLPPPLFIDYIAFNAIYTTNKGLILNSPYHKIVVKILFGLGHLPFHAARKLDNEHYGVNGTRWSPAFDFPNVGDVIPGIGTVIAIGLLTFMVAGDEESDEDSESDEELQWGGESAYDLKEYE
jgi:hypothetical protein